jgi:hypothetical protein
MHVSSHLQSWPCCQHALAHIKERLAICNRIDADSELNAAAASQKGLNFRKVKKELNTILG